MQNIFPGNKRPKIQPAPAVQPRPAELGQNNVGFMLSMGPQLRYLEGQFGIGLSVVERGHDRHALRHMNTVQDEMHLLRCEV